MHGTLTHVQGDLFPAVAKLSADNPKKVYVIPHIVNNQGGWGSGFVIPLAKHYPVARSQYLTDFAKGYLMLGTTNFIQVNNVWVVNMCAQTLGGQRPLYYNRLVECMTEVLYYLKEDLEDFSAVELHCPKFGSGLAGGNWDFIQELVLDCWVKEGLNVTVYSL